jgi:hypothetical protein
MFIESSKSQRLHDDKLGASDAADRQYAQGGIPEMAMPPLVEQGSDQPTSIVAAPSYADGEDILMLQLSSFEGRAKQ